MIGHISVVVSKTVMIETEHVFESAFISTLTQLIAHEDFSTFLPCTCQFIIHCTI